MPFRETKVWRRRIGFPGRPGQLALLLLLLAMPGALQAGDLPLIDAHSQIDQHIDPADIVRYLDEAGIAHVILSARGKTKGRTIAQLARNNPQRITAAVRTKGSFYKYNTPKYYKVLDAQLGLPDFKAMAEVILWHAEKPSRLGTVTAAKTVVPAADDRVRTALRAAIERRWPFIFHIEFAAAGGDADRFMADMEATLVSHPEHPFALIHMGQLGPDDVRRLIEGHPNIHFITAHTTPITTENSRQPWVNMFEDGQLTADWTALITQHPARFVLGFDNVWADHWGERYVRTATFWRRALAALPDAVAHAVAHRNAERLWRLPPAQ